MLTSLPTDSNLGQLVNEQSVKHPIAFFKHSPRCGVSLMVRKQFMRELERIGGDVLVYEIDVLSQRQMARELSELTSIGHESPQLIVVSSGDAVYAASHHGISWQEATSALS